jgi:hypothetical protein
MRSHFTLDRGVTAACAVVSTATLLSGTSSAQLFSAADYATNPIYAGGWSAGQNGGYGFGPWNFDATVDNNGNSDPGGQQEITTASALGTAWTLFNLGSAPAGAGISDVGRGIPGGLEPGQTLEMFIQNPTAYNFYGGFDILFANATDNSPAGANNSELRLQVFNYFITNWKLDDGTGDTRTPLNSATDTAAGMKIDFTLTSTTNYSITLTPLSNPTAAYTQAGILASNLPINWINFRLYDGMSTGPSDTADNFEISSMTIAGVDLSIRIAGGNAILSWPVNADGLVNLLSSTNLGPTAVWNPVATAPVVVNGFNVVTNPLAGPQQFYRVAQSQVVPVVLK